MNDLQTIAESTWDLSTCQCAQCQRVKTQYVKVGPLPPPPAPLFVGMASGAIILGLFLLAVYQIAKALP